MRSINLLKVAAEAELIRIKALIARQGRRAAFGTVGVIFVLGVLTWLEILGWQAARLYLSPIIASLTLTGINLMLTLIFGALAARSSPSYAEIQAARIRRESLDAARGALSLRTALSAAMLLPRLRRGRRRR